ncbi:DUF7139 domain-containing protein [Halostella salina]|uniref:DUF7139 domain-containing protein n=1 Tax=Halostella salina TaxID=1547897 RepID=UPI000EF7CFA4|nr:NADH-quinone oxidoreductase subunit J [Halostella salina]
MTSLEEVYEGHVGEVQSVRRLYLGTGLFLVGAALAVVGMVVATTGVLAAAGVDRFGSRLVAGVLGGVGFPTVVLGVFTVLPAETRIRAAAAIGASVTALGVALFWYAYPDHWAGYGRDLTFVVTAVYFLGVITLIGCLFAGIATFKRRNDPGGTVRMEVTKQGETKVIEVDRSELGEGFGSIGTFGETPDGEVETQTNRPDKGSTQTGRSAGSSRGETTASGGASGSVAEPATGGSGGTPGPASDGGSAASDITSPLDGRQDDGEVMDDGPSPTELTDTYCGNCEHFEYVRTGRGMQPYCGYHGERMDDMEACDQWEPNN